VFWCEKVRYVPLPGRDEEKPPPDDSMGPDWGEGGGDAWNVGKPAFQLPG